MAQYDCQYREHSTKPWCSIQTVATMARAYKWIAEKCENGGDTVSRVRAEDVPSEPTQMLFYRDRKGAEYRVTELV